MEPKGSGVARRAGACEAVAQLARTGFIVPTYVILSAAPTSRREAKNLAAETALDRADADYERASYCTPTATAPCFGLLRQSPDRRSLSIIRFRFARISNGRPRTFAALAHQRWSNPRALIERISGENSDVADSR